MALTLHLVIEQRRPDRVFVLIELQQKGEPLNISGAAVELRSARGVLVSPRMILPIAGELAGPLATRVELRAQRAIPQGAKVYGVVFHDKNQTEATIPVDPCTELEAHVRGRGNICRFAEKPLEPLTPADEYALQQAFPWAIQDDEEEEYHDTLDADDLSDEVAKSLGLDDEEAEFLREILTDQEPSPEP